jgi:hypothetical protein
LWFCGVVGSTIPPVQQKATTPEQRASHPARTSVFVKNLANVMIFNVLFVKAGSTKRAWLWIFV